MGLKDDSGKDVSPGTQTLATSYTWEANIPCQGSLSGRLLLDLTFGSAATLTLKVVDCYDSSNDYERARNNAGTGELDEIALTIADFATVDTTLKRIGVPIDCPHASRIKVQAKVDSTTGTPSLAARWLADRQGK